MVLLVHKVDAATYPTTLIGTSDEPVRVTAAGGERWTKDGETVIRLNGSCTVRSGASVIAADSAILWLVPKADEKTGESAVDVYAEKDIRVVERGVFKKHTGPIYARMKTRIGVQIRVSSLPQLREAPNVPLYADALKARYPEEPLPWKIPTIEEVLFARKDVQVHAETSLVEKQDRFIRAILHGDVRVETADMRLFADDVILWFEQTPDAKDVEQGGELAGVYAEGSVIVFSSGSSLRADQFYLDPRTYEGMATNAVFRTDERSTGVPMVFSSPAMRELDRNTLLARQGYVTTCEFGVPDYRIAGHNIRVVQGSPRFTWSPTTETRKAQPGDQTTRAPAGETAPSPAPPAKDAPAPSGVSSSSPEEKPALAPEDQRYRPDSIVVSTRDNIFYVGPYPVFYWPYLARDVKSGGYLLRSIRFESSKEFGPTVKTSWNLYDLGLYYNEWSNATLNLDYYWKRGLGTGVDFEYEGPSRFGFLTTYYIRDRADTELGGQAVEKAERGRILWRHRELLEDDWRADVEFAWRSDRNFLPVYFEKEFFEGKPQETLLYLRKLDDNRAYTGLLKVRVNDFDTTVERLPEFGLQWLAEPFWQNRLLWNSKTSLSYLKLKFDDDRNLQNPDGTARFDTEHSVSYPFNIGWLQLDPYAGGAFTAYSNQANSNNATGRLATFYGLRAGTNFYRTYDAENELFDVHGIRHIITPTLNYRHTFFVSEPPTKFTQYDAAIDGRDRSQDILFRLRNRWQTKRGPVDDRRSVDFLTADIDFNIFPGNAGLNAAKEDFIEFNSKWQVNEYFALTSNRTRYNLERSQFDVINVGFDLTYWQPIRINYSHDFIRGVNGTMTRSISVVKLAYQPEWSRWRVEIQQNYDFKGDKTVNGVKRPKNLGTILAVSRDLHCWLLTLAVEYAKGKKAGGTTFRIQLQPKFLSVSPVEL